MARRTRRCKAPYSQMRVYDQGSEVRVTVGEWGVHEFRQMWPGSTLPDRTVSFTFDKRNGDLVDLHPYSMDGEDAAALADDAWKYAECKLGRR